MAAARTSLPDAQFHPVAVTRETRRYGSSAHDLTQHTPGQLTFFFRWLLLNTKMPVAVQDQCFVSGLPLLEVLQLAQHGRHARWPCVAHLSHDLVHVSRRGGIKHESEIALGAVFRVDLVVAQ
jgi:hypothetical protein